MTKESWFEISNAGWRRLNAGRPLRALVREAVQNAFDEDVSEVRVSIDADTICIEDDGRRGFVDQRLVYTIFLSDKADSPTRRGRKGRGLKELLSAADTASVETVGSTVFFDGDGRRTEANQRQRGTRVGLERRTLPRDVDDAVAGTRMMIPPEGTRLWVNGREVRRPRHFVTLEACRLDTVVTRAGIERLVERETTLELYHPRRGEDAQVFEMGIPVQPVALPWHVDVGQRIPLADGRRELDELYRLTLFVTLFESLIDDLSDRALRDAWIDEVLLRCEVSDEALSTYVSRAFPVGAVLATSTLADDRARQAGAHVIDARGMSRGVYETLSRVMETSAEMVDRRLRAQEEAVEPSSQLEARVVLLYEHLARRILGRRVLVSLMRKPANLAGIIDDAVFERQAMELKLNLLGSIDLADPLSPDSLAILFHELAHARTDEHDHQFIRELERVAARGARLLADEAPRLRNEFGL